MKDKYIVQSNYGHGWENTSNPYEKDRALALKELFERQPKYRIKKVATPRARVRGY